jgi:cytochrome c-type biogenesis protein CcmH
VRAWIAVVATLIALVATAAAAAANCTKTSVSDLEDEVMCPVCGTALGLAAEAPQAQQQRDYIQELISQCRSKDEVKQALVAEFGQSVLALPGDQEDDDFGDVLVYAVPAIGIALAAGGIAFAVVRWRRHSGTEGSGPALAGTDGSRLEDDMDRYDL